MKIFEELSKADKFEIPLFMHHPSLKKRKKRTIKLMPKILKIRKQAKVFINFDYLKSFVKIKVKYILNSQFYKLKQIKIDMLLLFFKLYLIIIK